MLRMAHRYGQSIGRIARDLARQLQQRAHHVHDLHFVGTTKPDRGELDCPRRVLGELNRRPKRCERRATCLAELESTLYVAIDEDFLHGHFVGLMHCDEFGDASVNAREALD